MASLRLFLPTLRRLGFFQESHRLLDYIPRRFLHAASGISHVLADGEGRVSIVADSVRGGRAFMTMDARKSMGLCQRRPGGWIEF